MKLLLLHSSTDGHTIRIMQHIASHLAGSVDCSLLDLHSQPRLDPAAWDRVIIGASVRYGHFNKALYIFIKNNHAALDAAGAAFFGVNLTARKPGKDRPGTSPYIRKFLRRSAWHPQQMALFAGALNYSRYGFFDRNMIRLIMKLTGGPTDPETNTEFTNWVAVTAFADRVISGSSADS